MFIVEGATNTKRLFQSDYRVHSVIVVEHRAAEITAAAPESTLILAVPNELATQLVGFKFHIGVLAAAYRKAQPELPSLLSHDGPSLIVLGDHIIDQQNVGMLIRISSAFGADAVVLGPGSADPFSRRVVKVSMCNGLFLPIAQSTSTIDTLNVLRSLNYRICATVLDENAEELTTFLFGDRTVLLFGNETTGLSEEVQALCDHRLTISMLNQTDSLNVGIVSHTWRLQFPRQH